MCLVEPLRRSLARQWLLAKAGQDRAADAFSHLVSAVLGVGVPTQESGRILQGAPDFPDDSSPEVCGALGLPTD